MVLQHTIWMVLQRELNGFAMRDSNAFVTRFDSNGFAARFEWFCETLSNGFAMRIKWIWATRIQTSKFKASMFQAQQLGWCTMSEKSGVTLRSKHCYSELNLFGCNYYRPLCMSYCVAVWPYPWPITHSLIHRSRGSICMLSYIKYQILGVGQRITKAC